MGEREEWTIASRCHAICKLEGNLRDKAVFVTREYDDKSNGKMIYHCGLGERDCIMIYLCQKSSDAIKGSEKAVQEAHRARGIGPFRLKG